MPVSSSCWTCLLYTSPLPESLTATSLVILNGEGDMMAEREADAPRSPSSLTKMLSIYLILDELDRGKLSLSDTFTVPPELANTRGSKYGLRTGQTVTVAQLLAGTILNSGCDLSLIHILFARNHKTNLIGSKNRLRNDSKS